MMRICDKKRATAAAVLLLAGIPIALYVYSSLDTDKVMEWVQGPGDSIRFEASPSTPQGRESSLSAVLMERVKGTDYSLRFEASPNRPISQGREQPTNITRQLYKISPPKSTVSGIRDLESIDRKRALVLGHRKNNRGYLTIGITTAKRKNASYLKMTLQSLIDNANEQERDQLRIVVLACDLEAEKRQEAHQIVSGFPEHLQSGLLQLIEAPKSFYLPLTNLKRTFNDADVRVRWRAKEIQDVVFLFAYSVGMSEYYMMLDDDLTTFPRYVQRIRNFVDTHLRDRWFMLDICELGTGKLFRDNDLLHVGRTLAEFYQEKPVDLLLFSLMKLRNQERHFVLIPPLFKHLGQVSTLSVKNRHLGTNYT